MKKITIAYISESSPHDKHAWSGTVHYIYQTLISQGHKLIAAGPARPFMTRYFLAAMNKLSLFIFKKRFDYRHSGLYTKAFGAIYSRRLKKMNYDLVLVCGTSECGAYLQTDKPVVYVLDRTIEGAINYHKILSDLWHFSMTQSISTDKKAMKDAKLLFFSSDWAADHARTKYGIPDDRIVVAPFGANMDAVPDRQTALQPKHVSNCKLLLIGTNWKNKGADIAYKTMLGLISKGVDAELTVAGCTAPPGTEHPKLKVIPFIDKNSASGLKELWQLFLSHHFFILPTRFDCTPIVFCEASAFALPILSARTGGVEGHVKDGVNGFLLPYEDTTGETYMQKILEILKAGGKYQALRNSTRQLYEEQLNWNSWGNKFTETIQPILQTK